MREVEQLAADYGLKKAGVEINRKMLAELAVNDKAAFTTLTELSMPMLAGASPTFYRPQRTLRPLFCYAKA